MKTVTVSVRLPHEEAVRLDDAAARLGVERATFLKWAVRRGAQAIMIEQAFDSYRKGEATLSRAAEMAGLSLRDMILRLREHEVELSYTPDDLSSDLAD